MPDAPHRAWMADHQRQRFAVVVQEVPPEALDARDVLDGRPDERRRRTVLARQKPVPLPLEHDHLRRLPCDLGYELHRACTSPDHRDALAAEVVAVIPLRGVEAVARELVAAVDAGKRRLVELPRRDDDRVGVPRAAVGALDRPAAQLVVPPARADFGVQDDQPVDAVIAGDSVQVIEDLALRRAQPRPVAALGE